VERVFRTGEVEQLEYPLELQGRTHRFLADIKRVGTPDDGMTVVLFARDVTELRATELALSQAERLAALGVLAAGVGHEINNPLSYVLGNVGVVLDALKTGSALDDASRAELIEALADAQEGGQRIAEIVASLRLFSRAGSTREEV